MGERRQQGVTQTDIARELNISVVSVSNALNGRKGISPRLRQKILDVADEMGYEGVSSQNLRKEPLVRIGVLIARRYLRYSPSYYMKVYQEIVIAAQKKKCMTFLEILDAEDEKQGNPPKLFQDSELNGILVLGELEHPCTEMIQEKSPVPVIFVDYYDAMEEGDFIVRDDYALAYRLTRQLLGEGYKRISFVGRIDETSSVRDRFFGYRKALMERGIEVPPEWILPDREVPEGDIFVDLPREIPEAFVCCSDLTASILIGELRRNGFRVPEDVGVTGFDHFLMEKIEGVELDTCEVEMDKLAEISVNTLIRKINQTSFLPRMRIVTGKIIPGNSYRRAAGEEGLWKRA